MTKEKNKYQIVSAVLLIIVIAFASLYFIKASSSQEINEQTCSDFINQCPEPEEKAMITSELMSWNENLYNSSEMFYTFNLYNYGNSEAKNIKVTCKSFESDTGKLIAKDIDSFGNLASNSYDQYELITNNVPTDIDKEYISLCYVESCENCEILHNNIPELAEVYTTD